VERQLSTVSFTSEVAEADVLLLIVGPRWVRDDDTSPSRLLDVHDPVRRVLEGAMSRGTRAVPLLVRGAQFPSPDDLPEHLQSLRQINAWPISHQGFRDDIASLLAGLSRPPREAGAVQAHVEISSPPGLLKRAARRDNDYVQLAIDGINRGALRMHNQTRTFDVGAGTHTITVSRGKKEQALDLTLAPGEKARVRVDVNSWAWTPGPNIERLS